ncbi:MAG: hypothetical protein NTZ10_01110 [Candidatus Saganbacteria bacterium]|nr:hypothetical protein [Candidatus Saganbacteria bacterium]
MRKVLVVFICLFPFMLGCSQVSQYNTKKYEPQKNPGKIGCYNDKDIDFAYYSGDKIKISAAMIGYNYIIASSVKLINNTGADIEPGEYSIALFDGRDLKPVRLLTRDEVQSVKNTVAGGPGSSAIQDQIINTSVNTIMGALDAPTKGKLTQIIQYGIDNYFSFRPIYKGSERNGILCFISNFRLEYPLTLRIKVKGQAVDLLFNPKKN